jgi:hypothetical protein
MTRLITIEQIAKELTKKKNEKNTQNRTSDIGETAIGDGACVVGKHPTNNRTPQATRHGKGNRVWPSPVTQVVKTP